MAKINWTFQDESGTNLNRYIATNVNTGEKITFDLLRGANITIIGTPLNAEKLNQIIKSINEAYNLIQDLDEEKNVLYKHNINIYGQDCDIYLTLLDNNNTQYNTKELITEWFLERDNYELHIRASGNAIINGQSYNINSFYLNEDDDALYISCFNYNNQSFDYLEFNINYQNIHDEIEKLNITNEI